MQEEIIGKIRWLMDKVGMGDNVNEEEVKISKIDKTRQTPTDMTGNELDFNEKRKKTNHNKKNESAKLETFYEEDD